MPYNSFFSFSFQWVLWLSALELVSTEHLINEYEVFFLFLFPFLGPNSRLDHIFISLEKYNIQSNVLWKIGTLHIAFIETSIRTAYYRVGIRFSLRRLEIYRSFSFSFFALHLHPHYEQCFKAGESKEMFIFIWWIFPNKRKNCSHRNDDDCENEFQNIFSSVGM